MKRGIKTTPAQQDNYDRAHQERLLIIAKPFPAIRRIVDFGASWAGCLVPRPFDGMFLAQREVTQHIADMRSEREGRYDQDFAYDQIEL